METDEDNTKEQMRLQFQSLQEQQLQHLHERLEKKKQISFEKEMEKMSLNRQDSLKLSEDKGDSVPKQSNSITLLKQENDQLQEHIRELQDENGRLRKLLREKEFDMKYLEKKREEDRLTLTGTAGLARDAAAIKIVELSKKNRELLMEIEREKAKCKQLNNRVRDLERELHDTAVDINRVKADHKLDLGSSQQESIQEKLNMKMSEYRNQIQAVKQELKVAHKVQCAEFKGLFQAATVERDRLLELSKVQQRREGEAIQKYTEAEQKLLCERRHCVLLQQQLERMKLDPEKNKELAGQQEDLDVLRTSLEQVLQAKEEDLQLYSTMINQVKQVYLQALRQHKQTIKQEI